MKTIITLFTVDLEMHSAKCYVEFQIPFDLSCIDRIMQYQ